MSCRVKDSNSGDESGEDYACARYAVLRYATGMEDGLNYSVA